MSQEIIKQYKDWPYPDIPLVATISREQLWQINVEWMLKKAGLPPPSEKPKIWIAGCGTFEPYTFSQANPHSEILAADASPTSLAIAKRRCWLHLKRNVHFQRIDLEVESQYPQDKFDFIECYGVLMNLKNPDEVLKRLSERLKPGGLMRIMVYPHYGRQPIFQLQRLATLLGFSRERKEDPRTFRRVMRSLGKDNTLRQSFFSYADSKTDSGIVDAFLHAGDRAFTGTEICQSIERAGLSIAYTMHRPWGNPRIMAEQLGLQGKDAAYMLNYLDVWQSLRSNFILVLSKTGTPREKKTVKGRHSLFALDSKGVGLGHRLRLVRFSFTGAKVQTRTYDGPKDLSAKAIRKMILKQDPNDAFSKEVTDPEPEEPLEPLLSEESRKFKPTKHWVLRPGGPHPRTAHLQDASLFKVGRWETLGDDRMPVRDNGIDFSAAGDLLTNEQQRRVFKFIDSVSIPRNQWEKHEILELSYLID